MAVWQSKRACLLPDVCWSMLNGSPHLRVRQSKTAELLKAQVREDVLGPDCLTDAVKRRRYFHTRFQRPAPAKQQSAYGAAARSP